MKVLAIAAIAGTLLVFPASAEPLSVNNDMIRLAQADVSVRIGGDGPAVRVGPRRHHDRQHVRVREHHADCRTVVIKERRGDTMITKRIKKC